LRRAAAWLSVLAALGCGGGISAPDGGSDGGDDGGPTTPVPNIPWLGPDGTVALQPLLPCPEGWREVVSDGAIATCDPYPAGGPAVCPRGQAHFPGEPGCAPIGRACPTGDFAEGLPDDGTVRFVLAGATGGDGTRGRPFGRIAEALAVATAGTTVAVGAGRYEELLALRAGVTLAGACVERTVIAFAGTDPRPAVLYIAGAGVTVRDVSIEESDRVGIQLDGSGDLSLEGVAVTGVTTFGIGLPGGRLRARGLVVRDTRPGPMGFFGRGLEADYGATVEVSRGLFEGNREAGLFAATAGTVLTLADLAVRDTVTGNPASGTAGLVVQVGASASVTRALFERNRDIGIFSGGSGAQVTLSDVVVRDTLGREDDRTRGRGLEVGLGAAGDVRRALFERNRQLGVLAKDEGSVLALTDVVVRDTIGEESDGSRGLGLSVEVGATGEVSRVLIERNREFGILVSEGAVLTLSDVLVRDTEALATTGAFGRGLQAQLGSRVEVSRALFERNREVGVLAGSGSTVVLGDVIVRDTRADEAGLAGIGVGSYLGGGIELRRFVVTGSALAGVQIARMGAVDLHEGEISGNLVGVNVQAERFDLARLMDRVVFVDNVRDFAADELPVPEPGVPSP
jgi:hypothetical protein